ncbi:MAG: NADH-quinone oxidoreductase subunit L, partial [Planctomycetota bacterium]
MLELIWLVPLLPLLGFASIAVLGRVVDRRVVSTIAWGAVGLSFLFSILVSFALVGLDPQERVYPFELYRLISTSDMKVSIGLLLDPLSMVMILIVTGVGFIIHIYSVGYMEDDECLSRYFSYLNLFVFFMLILVLADNLVLFFVGWEGVGLCSYLLIGFWYEKEENAWAGKKAFIVTRLGDAGFIIGIFFFFTLFSTVEYLPIFEDAHKVLEYGGMQVTILTLLLLFGALGKSAQLPLQVWLPDAMRGPTPVSALIHAATMVTAGVYMIARFNPIFQMAPVTMFTVAVIGLLTALYGASTALVQRDIKKVLAYSTISQLGYMFMAVGVGAFTLGIYHLMTHAFFKALLFLGAGCVIHAFKGEHDIFKMGGLKGRLPMTFWTFLAAALALSAFPGTSGFFSKDAILFASAQSNIGPLLWTGGVIAAFLTSLYIFRVLFVVFFGDMRGEVESPPRVMELSLIVL